MPGGHSLEFAPQARPHWIAGPFVRCTESPTAVTCRACMNDGVLRKMKRMSKLCLTRQALQAFFGESILAVEKSFIPVAR